jgi:hypothetical protein
LKIHTRHQDLADVLAQFGDADRQGQCTATEISAYLDVCESTGTALFARELCKEARQAAQARRQAAPPPEEAPRPIEDPPSARLPELVDRIRRGEIGLELASADGRLLGTIESADLVQGIKLRLRSAESGLPLGWVRLRTDKQFAEWGLLTPAEVAAAGLAVPLPEAGS